MTKRAVKLEEFGDRPIAGVIRSAPQKKQDPAEPSFRSTASKAAASGRIASKTKDRAPASTSAGFTAQGQNRAEPTSQPGTPVAPRKNEQLIDSETLETMLAKARGKGKADGFAEGVAMAEQRAESELRMLLQAIREQIADQQITRAEMDTHVIQNVGNICQTMFRAVSPALTQAGLTAEIASAVNDALRRAPQSTILVTVSPERSARVAEALASDGLPVRIDDDPELGDLEARVHWHGGFDAIDFEDCLAGISKMIEKFTAQSTPQPSAGEADTLSTEAQESGEELPVERRKSVNE